MFCCEEKRALSRFSFSLKHGKYRITAEIWKQGLPMTAWGNIEFEQLASHMREKRNSANHYRLLEAIRENDLTEFFTLIESGTQVNFVYDNMTPLIMAMDYDNLNMFKLLLESGANSNFIINGYSLIWESLWQHKTDFFVTIIPYAKKNNVDENGKTLLMEAVDYSNTEAVEACLKAGFPPNAQDLDGNTALHFVLAKEVLTNQDKEIVQLLLQYGADPTITNNNGNSASDVGDKSAPSAPVPQPQTPKNTHSGPKRGNRRVPKLRPR